MIIMPPEQNEIYNKLDKIVSNMESELRSNGFNSTFIAFTDIHTWRCLMDHEMDSWKSGRKKHTLNETDPLTLSNTKIFFLPGLKSRILMLPSEVIAIRSL